MQMKNILMVIGIRLEAIKLIPIVVELNNNDVFRNKLCITRQHTSLLDSFFSNNNIKIDYQFKPCKQNAALSKNAAHMLLQFNDLLEKINPDLIIVQGDTTERSELIDAGTGILVGTDTTNIVKYCKLLLEDHVLLSKMSKIHFPYGDGYASKHIVKILEQIL